MISNWLCWDSVGINYDHEMKDLSYWDFIVSDKRFDYCFEMSGQTFKIETTANYSAWFWNEDYPGDKRDEALWIVNEYLLQNLIEEILTWVMSGLWFEESWDSISSEALTHRLRLSHW